jgi:hypothetical protein
MPFPREFAGVAFCDDCLELNSVKVLEIQFQITGFRVVGKQQLLAFSREFNSVKVREIPNFKL